MSTLSDYTQRIHSILGLPPSDISDLNSILHYWIGGVCQISPTWKNLLLIIRLLNLDDLAQRMETYLSGAIKELSSIGGEEGEGSLYQLRHYPIQCCVYHSFVGDEDEQLRLRDDTMFHLKQQMSTMQKRIENLKSEVGELRSRLSLPPIKEEGTYMTQALL